MLAHWQMGLCVSHARNETCNWARVQTAGRQHLCLGPSAGRQSDSSTKRKSHACLSCGLADVLANVGLNQTATFCVSGGFCTCVCSARAAAMQLCKCPYSADSNISTISARTVASAVAMSLKQACSAAGCLADLASWGTNRRTTRYQQQVSEAKLRTGCRVRVQKRCRAAMQFLPAILSWSTCGHDYALSQAVASRCTHLSLACPCANAQCPETKTIELHRQPRGANEPLE